MFEGFELAHIRVGEVELRVRYGGAGPAVLLLHGHPRTHTTWYRVAPLLAERFTVVCPDTRGYGESSKPKTSEDHAPYSKRAMAGDCVSLMRELGHARFAVAGHDRGCYVALRAALDYPAIISHLAALDGVPIGEALARCTSLFAIKWWHWFFMGNPNRKAETAISADPDAWYGPTNNPASMGAENYADYRRAIHNPQTIHAMCEDYRAGLTIDRLHDDNDRDAARHVQCPTLVLWAAQDDLCELYGDVLSVWKPWAPDLRGHAVDCGHHIAEERPQELAAELARFFSQL